MKTNHQRGFKAKDNGKNGRIRRVLSGKGLRTKSLLADVGINAKYPGVAHDRYNRRAIAGAKKFVRTRLRFHDNAATKELARYENQEADGE
jgi:hypothetical protein